MEAATWCQLLAPHTATPVNPDSGHTAAGQPFSPHHSISINFDLDSGQETPST